MIIAFHKPFGVLCQFTQDRPGQRTLAEFGFPKGVYPLGRLDMDSEGLLLLSDEPGLNDRILNPKNAHSRIYEVQVEGIPEQSAMEKLSNGSIFIKNHRCLPCKVELPKPQPLVPPREPPIRVRQQIPDCWIRITLVEGKNRQVRRMTAAVGHPTLRLVRISIGDYSNRCLTPGNWEILNTEAIEKLGI